MDVLTDTMSTMQMQSKTGRDDAMIEAERKKMYSFLDAQAAVKAEDYAYDDVEDAIRRNASDDLFAGYKAGKASQAAVKAENDEEDALTDAYDEEDALTATSDDFYTGYIIGKASQMQSKTGRSRAAKVDDDATATQVHRDTLAALVRGGQTKYLDVGMTSAKIEDATDVMIEAERGMYSILDAQAAVKAENDAYDEEDALTAASDDLYAGYRIGKASQAAVEAEYDNATNKLFRKKINSITARRDALHKFKEDHHV